MSEQDLNYVPRGGQVGEEFEIEKYNLGRESRVFDEFAGEPSSAGLLKRKDGAGNLLVDDSFSMD